METAVGKKPSALTPRIFTEFNQIFLELYGEFEKKKVYEYQTSNYESKGVLKHGDFTLGKVRNWLAYHQLIVVQKLHEPDKQGKMKTVWQLGPTKLGKQAYEHGAVIEVEAHQKTQVGIGKMYPDFDKLWKTCLAQAENDGVARTRREQWEWQFRDLFILKLAAIQEEDAKVEAMSWVRKLIAESPRKGHRNKLKHMPNYNAVALEGEHLLGTQQSLVDFWPTKYKPKKPKETPYQNGLRRALVEECEKATVFERPKENTAHITIDATLQSQQLGGEFIPYFHTYYGISIVGGLGSMSGGGGALYNAKHIALSVKHFITEALHYSENFESDRIVTRKNIKVEWTERAKTLWKQTVGKKIIPEAVFGHAMNLEYADQLLLKIQPNDTTNVWRGLENYNVQNYEIEDCLGSMRHGEALDYCIWLYEKAGKKRKEIISILEKSRQFGFNILYDAALRERIWNLKQAEEAKDIVVREATRARNREMLQSEWLDPHSSIMWRYDWVWHLLDDEANIQKWAKLIGVEYECPDKALEIFEQAVTAFESVDINSLPVSKKGLGVKSLTGTKAKVTEMATVESHPKQSVQQPKSSTLSTRLVELHEEKIAKYTKPTTKPKFRKGQTIWVENEQRTVLATKWCVDGRPEWFYAFEPEGYSGMVQNGKTWQIETALQEVELSKLTKEEKESHVKGILTELQKDPYTFDVRNWKHGINPTEIKKRFKNPRDYPNVSGSRIFTIFRELKPYGCTEKQLVDALMLVRKTQLKWHVDVLFNEGNGFYKKCLEEEIENNKTRQPTDVPGSTNWLEHFKSLEEWRQAQNEEAGLKYEPYPWAAELLKKYEHVVIKEAVVTTIEDDRSRHKTSKQATIRAVRSKCS